jgi:hypothetical protein
MLDTVTLKEVLSTMDTGAIFSIGIRTYDKKKETGGEWIGFTGMRKARLLNGN